MLGEKTQEGKRGLKNTSHATTYQWNQRKTANRLLRKKNPAARNDLPTVTWSKSRPALWHKDAQRHFRAELWRRPRSNERERKGRCRWGGQRQARGEYLLLSSNNLRATVYLKYKTRILRCAMLCPRVSNDSEYSAKFALVHPDAHPLRQSAALPAVESNDG